nr:reverse transcriptase domain-containing protein [Tanacetum cinerariifolium]
GIVSTEMELELEQSQQGSSHEVSVRIIPVDQKMALQPHSSGVKIQDLMLNQQIYKAQVKIAFENANSSSRVELIPSKIKYANKGVVAVVMVLEVVAARGGEWYGGSYRSGEGEHFWGLPEKSPETATDGGDCGRSEAWDRFKDLFRACPHHGFSKLHQLDTFYNALNSKDQDSLNYAAVPVVAKVSTNTSTSGISPDVAELRDMVKALLLDKKSQNQALATVKAVEESCVTCGGAHSYRNCLAIDGNIYRDNIQEFVSQVSAVNYNQGNTSYRPLMMSNQIRPPGFPPVPNNQNVQLTYVKANDAVMRNMQTQDQDMQNQLTNLTDLLTKFMNSNNASTSSSDTLPSNTIANPRSDLKAITTRSEATKDTVHPTNNESTKDVQPPVVQSKSPILTSEPVNSPIIEPVVSPVSASRPNQRPSIPYPSRMQDQKLRDKANDQRAKFFQIFEDLNFNISFADALILMPKFGPSIKSLLTNKDKLCELPRTPLNEHYSAVLLKKLPEKLGDPGKFLISCDFPGKAECLTLADLSAIINLMPLSMWNKLSLTNLTPTCMTLELADRSISHPVGVAEDVYVKVGTFHFLANFVVVDFDADPRVPLIVGRSFLKTGRALIDVFEGKLTLREVLAFSDVIASGNPTPYYDPIVSTTSPTLTPFGNSDFLLEEVDAFLALEDDPTLPELINLISTLRGRYFS